MKKSIYFLAIFLVGVFAFSLNSCKDKDPVEDPVVPSGHLIIKFDHLVNGSPIQYDTMIYTNAAGNLYSVRDIIYMISRIKLYKHGGGVKEINAQKFYHYIDNTIPTTLTYNVYDAIPVGNYDSISFTFGFDSIDNKSYMFVNPPESNFDWPDVLGGGYHYMQLNGNFKQQDNNIGSLTLHLGVGQIYNSSGDITGFIHNNFNVSIPSSSFSISDNENKTIHLNMNVEEWFKNPNLLDLNAFDPATMQNQDIMHKACQNGADVFTFGL